jgi:hypothetical protein
MSLDLHQTGFCPLIYGTRMSADLLLALGAALLFGAIFIATFATAWRMLHDDGRLRLRRLLARQGVRLSLVADQYYDAARATRRCVACADKSRCDAWLALHRREGFDAFCPNAGFISRFSHR